MWKAIQFADMGVRHAFPFCIVKVDSNEQVVERSKNNFKTMEAAQKAADKSNKKGR